MWQSRRHVKRAVYNFQKGSLLAQDQFLALCHLEIVPTVFIGSQTGAIGFVSGQRIKSDQAPGNVVSAFVGKKVADEVTTTTRNKASPILGVLSKVFFLKRINLVANENRDHGHALMGLLCS